MRKCVLCNNDLITIRLWRGPKPDSDVPYVGQCKFSYCNVCYRHGQPGRSVGLSHIFSFSVNPAVSQIVSSR